MPEASENLLVLASSCIYYARQTRETYKVFSYSVAFKAPAMSF